MASIDQKVEVCGNSPERIYVTEANRSDENVRRHVARYEFAAQHIPDGSTILDCACGSGYGTAILRQSVTDSSVIGVDYSQEAVVYAHEHHHEQGISYHWLGVELLRLRYGTLDALVTLETLEHIHARNCQEFLCDAARWIKPGGVIVASSPMLRYQNGVPYVTSPHHINEMPRDLLLSMFLGEFPERDWVLHFYHQEQEAFLPLLTEDTGFCVVVGRKRK